MKLLSIRCAICESWHHANHGHCPSCGAITLRIGTQTKRYDVANGRELVRGIPMSLHKSGNMNWSEERTS